MFRRKELLCILLVQACITLALSRVTPNVSVSHPVIEQDNAPIYFHQQASAHNF